MKKWILFAAPFALLLLLAGCGRELVYLEDILPDSGTAASETGQATPPEDNPYWTPIPVYDADAPHAERLSWEVDTFVETKNCIVFRDARSSVCMKYINKTTGEVHVLCGDPLCGHSKEIERCAAVCDSITLRALVYVPETGRLYFAREEDAFAPASARCCEIVSIGIDEMDFTLTYHGKTKPGDRIRSMRYDDGTLYYTYYALNGDSDKTEIKMDALSLSSGSVRTVVTFSDTFDFIVKNGVVYYVDSWLSVLYAYDIGTGEETVLWTPELTPESPSVSYTYFNGSFFCVSETEVTEIDRSGREIRTLWRHEETPYVTEWTPGAGGTWSLGYDPHPFEQVGTSTDRQTGKKETFTIPHPNPSGGKILLWEGDGSRLYTQLDEYAEVMEINAVGSCVFLRATVWNTDRTKNKDHYYYSFGGEAYDVPEKGFPQGK